jgi:UDP-N-acetylmuramoylalanine--D-glutamate ligase
MDYKDFFKDKKITVMGLGLLGRGVGDVDFLSKQGAILTVTDLKTESELKPSLDKLKSLKGIKYVLGGHKLEDFRDCDIVLKAAGVPLSSPFLEEARKNHIPIEMSTALFVKHSPATVVGITGTRGKSTTTAMISQILKVAERKFFEGGNVKGISTLAHLPESSKEEIAVLELDSWQLQGFEESKISPHIAVFTTFYADHLDYYKNDLDKYFEDKSNIFKFQLENDFLILGEQVVPIIKEKAGQIKSQIIISNSSSVSEYEFQVPGEHNRYNAACAREAVKILGIDDNSIKRGLEAFKGIEGRLELVKKVNRIKIYNDTTSTTPEATLAALRAFGGSRTVLIMGGSDKGLDLTELLQSLSRFCKAVVLLPGSGTEKIKSEIENLNLKVVKVSDLKEAVREAINLSKSSDTILFSPAFASFGPPPGGFSNEYERGEEFNKVVSSL